MSVGGTIRPRGVRGLEVDDEKRLLRIHDICVHPDFAARSSDRRGQKIMAIPINTTAARVRKSADCLNHAIAGTARAMARPRKQICRERKLTPARKVPSASN